MPPTPMCPVPARSFAAGAPAAPSAPLRTTSGAAMAAPVARAARERKRRRVRRRIMIRSYAETGKSGTVPYFPTKNGELSLVFGSVSGSVDGEVVSHVDGKAWEGREVDHVLTLRERRQEEPDSVGDRLAGHRAGDEEDVVIRGGEGEERRLNA